MAVRRSRTLRTLAVIAGAVALYGVLGGLVAPAIAKRVLASKLGERVGRTVQVDDVTFNPYTFFATVRGLRILDADGKSPFASFERLDVDGSIASIRHWAPVADALTLTGLNIRVVRDSATHYNFTDIVERVKAQTAAPKEKRDDEPARFSISNIRLVNAAVEFDDRPNNAVQRVTDVQVAIPLVSDLPRNVKDPVQPSFSANVNGTQVRLTGEALPFDKTIRTNFNLDIRALDVPRYLAYLPSGIPAKVDSGKLDAKIQLRFAQSPGKDPAVEVAGNAALDGVSISNADGPLGRLGRLEVDIASLDPLGGMVKLASMKLSNIATMRDDWKVGTIEARDIGVDVKKHTVRVASISTDAGLLNVKRNADGSVEAPHLTMAKAEPTPDANAPRWSIALDKVTMKGYAVTLADAAVKPAVTHRIDIASLEASNLTNENGFKGTATLKAKLERGGTLDASSTFALEPLKVKLDLDAQSIDLVPLRPYAVQFPTVALKSGRVSAKGTLDLASEGGAMRVAYTGSTRIDQLATQDTIAKEELLDWKSVAARGMTLRYAPDAPIEIAAGEIAVDGAYSRIVVMSDGKLNVQQLRTAAGEGEVSARAQAKAQERAAQPRNIRIDRITFANSRLNFTDHYIRPNYTADVGELNGSVTKLSSEPSSRANVALAGKWNATSPVVIAGTVNPLAGDLFLDIAAKGENIDLTKLTAYSARYAGYGITDGRLTLDVKYHVENGKLDGRNRILVDQLAFGDKVESPEATKLPVLFAINLLKDKNGRINLVLPVSGSLEDPKFDVMAVVSQLFSPMKTAETSPFSLITAGVADGDDLAYVEFQPGLATLTPKAEKKLASLVEVLQDRPGLKLEIAARVDETKDVEALKRAALEKRMASAPKDLSAEAREKLAAQPVEVDPQELVALATQRAEIVKGFLCAADRLPAERVVLASAPAKGGDGGKAVLSRVDFALR